MTTFSPREIVSELDRHIAKASGSEAVEPTKPTRMPAQELAR